MEIYLGLATTLFGLHLLQPFTDDLANYPAWSVMRHVFYELTWGIVITLVGAFQLTVAYRNTFTRKVLHLTIRECAALMMFFLWAFLSLFVGLSAPDSPAIVTFLVRALAEIWIFLQLRRPLPLQIQ